MFRSQRLNSFQLKYYSVIHNHIGYISSYTFTFIIYFDFFLAFHTHPPTREFFIKRILIDLF